MILLLFWFQLVFALPMMVNLNDLDEAPQKYDHQIISTECEIVDLWILYGRYQSTNLEITCAENRNIKLLLPNNARVEYHVGNRIVAEGEFREYGFLFGLAHHKFIAVRSIYKER